MRRDAAKQRSLWYLGLVLSGCLAGGRGAVAGDGVEQARQLLAQGKPDAAQKSLRSTLQTHPQDAEAWFLLGRASVANQQPDAAIEAYDKAMQLRPDQPEAYNNLAVLYAARGEDKRARDLLFSALQTHPSYAVTYQNLTRLYAALASTAYARALNVNNDDKAVSAGPPALSAVEVWSDARPKQTKATDANSGNDAKRQIQDMLNAWARAWAKADVDRYLKFYAPQFVLPEGTSRPDWEVQRRARLTSSRILDIKLRAIDVRPLDDATLALVNFDQIYRSSAFNDTVKKFLVVQRNGEHWQILQEVAGN